MTQNYHYSATCEDDWHRRPSQKSISIQFKTDASAHFASTRYGHPPSTPGVVTNQQSKSTGLALINRWWYDSFQPRRILNRPSSQPIFIYGNSGITMHIFTLSVAVTNINMSTVLTSFFCSRHKSHPQQHCIAPSDCINHAPSHHALRPSTLQPVFILLQRTTTFGSSFGRPFFATCGTTLPSLVGIMPCAYITEKCHHYPD